MDRANRIAGQREVGVTVTERNVLLVSHVRRAEALHATAETARFLLDAGIHPIMVDAERDELARWAAANDTSETALGIGVLGEDAHVADLELAVVLGGDGTILKAAEVVRSQIRLCWELILGTWDFLPRASVMACRTRYSVL